MSVCLHVSIQILIVVVVVIVSAKPELREGRSAVAVLEFSFWGPLGWRHFHLGHTISNTFVLNYRVCNAILASGGLILNFLGATGGPEISRRGAAAPLPPLEPPLPYSVALP